MINNTNRVKGVEVLFTILFLVVVSGTLHAQTSVTSSVSDDAANNTSVVASNNTWDNSTTNSTTNAVASEDYNMAPDAAEQTLNTSQGR